MKSLLGRLIHFLMLVLVVVLSPSCQDQRQDLISYTSAGRVWVMNPDGTQLCAAEETGFSTYRARWSPDGRRMLFTVIKESGQSIWVANSDGTDPRQVSTEFDHITGDWLNDELVLTDIITGSARPAQISMDASAGYILDLQDGTMRMYSRGIHWNVFPLPPGDHWITTSGYTGMFLHDLEGNATAILQEYSIGPDGLDVSPSGREIVFFEHDFPLKGGLYKALLEGSSVVEPTLVYSIDYFARVQWSPNGKHIALLDNQGALHVLDATTFSLISKFDLGWLADNHFVWSPHSDEILVERRYDDEPGKGIAIEEIVRVDIQTGAMIRLTNNDELEFAPVWQIIVN